jgi:hemophore-related protein
MTNISNTTARRQIAGIAGVIVAGAVGATIVAPTAAAAPDCSAAGVANTVSTVTGSARDYLNNHPGANQVISAAANAPRPEAASNLRAYFTAHPNQYYDLRGILAPIGDTQQQCNTTVLPPDLASAYSQFMAG